MSVDLLLPCIRFGVILHPSDPSQPTDLETAALFYIKHCRDSGGAVPDEVEAFMSLGSAIAQDLLIRMINRGWVTIEQDVPRRLRLSAATEALLEMPAAKRGSALRTLEEGKRFWVCYDLIGGGFAVIQKEFLSKSMDDPVAVPRQNLGAEGERQPFGKPLDGFLYDDPAFADSRDARIIEALQSDRQARDYLQGVRRASPYILVQRPGRILTLSDVHHYRCRFEVQTFEARPADGSGVLASDAQRVFLECVEQRNRAVRRLGALNAERILDFAVTARDVLEDGRFFRELVRHAAGRARTRARHIDPLESLKETLEGADDDLVHEDLLELWDAVVERINRLSATRIMKGSRLIREEDQRRALAELARSAVDRLIISSPIVRSRSRELTSEPNSALAVLSGPATDERKADVLVHATKGLSAIGAAVSDETALSRIMTAFGVEQTHFVDRALDHLRTPFILADDHSLLWQTAPLFGERPAKGLLLRFPEDGPGLRRAVTEALPSGLRDRLARKTRKGDTDRADGESGPTSRKLIAAWTAGLAAGLRDLEDVIRRMNTDDWSVPDRRAQLLGDAISLIDYLSAWCRRESQAAELLVGAGIRDRAMAMIGPGNDADPIVIGLSGRTDTEGVAELIEEIELRLSRQDLAGIQDVKTIVCLPDGWGFDAVADQFQAKIGTNRERYPLLRESERKGGGRPTAFVMSPTSTVIAQDGLVRFIPTAGRRVKGTHLGLQFHGGDARALAGELVIADWPGCAAEAPEDFARIDRPAPGPVPLSKLRSEAIVRRAVEEEWLNDGNAGADRARQAIMASEGDAAWSVALDRARVLIGTNEPSKRSVGRALLKAVAAAEEACEIHDLGARAALAEHEWSQERLLGAAILGESLPEGSALRDPFVRKLVLCVVRRVPPSLTPDEQALLAAPSPAVLSLASLLMLDGLGGGLEDWIAYIEATGQDARFAKNLAVYLRGREPRVLDLAHAGREGSGHRLESTIERLRQRLAADRTRRTMGLVRRVEKLSDLLFETEGSFPADLFQWIEKDWRGKAEAERPAALRQFLRKVEPDLGVDLFEAGRASATSVKIEALAETYFEKKNREMQRKEGEGAVLIHRAGRNMVTSLKTILTMIVHELVPAVIGTLSEAEAALTEAARGLLAIPKAEGDGPEAYFGRLLRERIREVARTEALHSPVWEFPRVALEAQPDWRKLRKAFLTSEFDRGASLPKVVNWFVEVDRAADDGSSAEGAEATDALLVLYDLLEQVDELDIDQTALEVRLSKIVENTRDRLGKAKTFLDTQDAAILDLIMAIRETENGLAVLEDSLTENDLVQGVLAADELRKGPVQRLLDRWVESSDKLREKFAERLSEPLRPELRRILPRLVTAENINHARTLERLQRWLTRPIEFDNDIRHDIREGRTPGWVSDGAETLIEVMAAVRADPKEGAALGSLPWHRMAEGVLAFFTGRSGRDHLATAKNDNQVWRISCAHPDIAALTFGCSSEAEILLPVTRDAEIRLRQTLQTDRSDPNTIRRGAGSVEPERTPRISLENRILISLHFNDRPPDMPTLVWRQLARLSRLPVAERRIAVLAELAQQRFATAGDIARWWAGTKGRRDDLLPALLGVSRGDLRTPVDEERLACQVRNLCLALGVFVYRLDTGLSIRPRGVSEMVRHWPDLACATLDWRDNFVALVGTLESMIGAAEPKLAG